MVVIVGVTLFFRIGWSRSVDYSFVRDRLTGYWDWRFQLGGDEWMNGAGQTPWI